MVPQLHIDEERRRTPAQMLAKWRENWIYWEMRGRSPLGGFSSCHFCHWRGQYFGFPFPTKCRGRSNLGLSRNSSAINQEQWGEPRLDIWSDWPCTRRNEWNSLHCSIPIHARRQDFRLRWDEASRLPVLNDRARLKTHFAGRNITLPAGFRVHQAVYRLRGGIRAQDEFFKIQSRAYEQVFKFKFSSNSMDILPSLSYIGPEFVERPKPTFKSKGSLTEYVSRKHLDLEKILPDSPTYVSSGSSTSTESEEEMIPNRTTKGAKKIDSPSASTI